MPIYTIQDDNTPYKRLVEQAAASVPNAVAGGQNLFIDSADHLAKLKNSSGVVSALSPVLVSDKKILTSGDKTVTGTTFADIDAGLNITLTTGARRCLCVVSAYGKHTGGGLQLDISIDGSRVGGTFGVTGIYALSNNGNLSFSFVTDVLSAASHTFKPQVRVDTGSGTLYASSSVCPFIFSVVEQLG